MSIGCEDQDCQDRVSVCDHVENVALLPFIAVQMSMVVCLLLHGRKEKVFRQAFYVFFVAVTIVDCVLLVVRRAKYYNTYRVNVYYYVPHSLPLQYVTDAIIPLGATAQPLLHLAIAANRFTAFVFPLKQSTLWRPRVLAATALVIAAMSATTVASGQLWFALIKAGKCRAGMTPDDDPNHLCDKSVGNLYAQDYSPQATYALANVLTTLSFCVCCVTSFALNLCTVVRLVLVRRRGTLKNMGPELRLFVHTLVMFLLQAVLTSQLLLQCWDIVASTTRAIGLFAWMFPNEYYPTSAELFFGIVNVTELHENPEGLDLDCLYDLNGCGVLYSVLSGNQTIVGALRVGDLTQHLFALSGSLFLLLMSNLVRNAYVEFYFKRFRRRHKVNIIRVTPTNSGANIG